MSMGFQTLQKRKGTDRLDFEARNNWKDLRSVKTAGEGARRYTATIYFLVQTDGLIPYCNTT
jgi:hypothetical protein